MKMWPIFDLSVVSHDFAVATFSDSHKELKVSEIAPLFIHKKELTLFQWTSTVDHNSSISVSLDITLIAYFLYYMQ